MNKHYDIRDYVEGDKNFIMATFMRGIYYGDSWFSLIPKDIFMGNYKAVGEALIASPRNIIKVACLKDDADIILGYSILSKDFTTLHFVFVKSAWRNQGIGKSLIPATTNTITHLTTLGRKLMIKLKDAIFNPFKQ